MKRSAIGKRFKSSLLNIRLFSHNIHLSYRQPEKWTARYLFLFFFYSHCVCVSIHTNEFYFHICPMIAPNKLYEYYYSMKALFLLWIFIFFLLRTVFSHLFPIAYDFLPQLEAQWYAPQLIASSITVNERRTETSSLSHMQTCLLMLHLFNWN